MNDTARTHDPQSEGHPRRWAALVLLLSGGFMNIMDVTIVNVALPSLQDVFDANSSQIEWVAAAYILPFALFLLPFGRLGDRIGRKNMFLIGIASFTVFSALCGLANSIETLIVARALQGVSSAMLMPQVLATVQVLFAPHERAHAFSYFGLSAGLASITGPLIGGLLIGADLFGMGWRWIFLVNVPIGMAVIVIGRRLIPDIAGHAGIRNDWGGITLAALVVFSLSLPLIEGHSLGWPSWTFAMMACAVPLGAGFLIYERWRARKGASQLLPLALMANHSFRLGTLLILIIFGGAMGSMLPMTLFLQQGFDFTPLQAGMTMAPFAAGVLVSSQVVRLFDGYSPRFRMATGALAYAAGMLALRFVISGVEDEIFAPLFSAPLFLSGIGMNLCIATNFQSALFGVPARDAGSGSGTMQAFQHLGSAFGIAIAGQIFFATLDTQFAAGQGRHETYVTALEMALIFNICAFLAVALLSRFIIVPPTGGNTTAPTPAARLEPAD